MENPDIVAECVTNENPDVIKCEVLHLQVKLLGGNVAPSLGIIAK